MQFCLVVATLETDPDGSRYCVAFTDLEHEEIIVPRGDSQIYPELLVRIMSMVRGYCFEVIYVASVSRMIRKKISSGALSHSSLVSTLGVRHCFALFRSVR